MTQYALAPARTSCHRQQHRRRSDPPPPQGDGLPDTALATALAQHASFRSIQGALQRIKTRKQTGQRIYQTSTAPGMRTGSQCFIWLRWTSIGHFEAAIYCDFKMRRALIPQTESYYFSTKDSWKLRVPPINQTQPTPARRLARHKWDGDGGRATCRDRVPKVWGGTQRHRPIDG